jgi:hypothetical protein
MWSGLGKPRLEKGGRMGYRLEKGGRMGYRLETKRNIMAFKTDMEAWWSTPSEVADAIFEVDMVIGRTRILWWNLDNRLEGQDAMIKVCLQSR